MNIGIDHGYYAVKTKRFSFPAGITAYSYECYTLQNTIEYEGRYYVCGMSRIDRDTVPKSLHVYEMRHDDNQQGLPVEIAQRILVNHWGTLLSSRPIRLLGAPGGRAYRIINPKRDWSYEGADLTVRKYMEQHPPRKEKRRVEER
mgnify:CR=1 FL=1